MPNAMNGKRLPPTMFVERSPKSLAKGAAKLNISMNNLGVLFTPRVMTGLDDATPDTRYSIVPWAADCDGFNGFKIEPYERMLEALTYRPGCRFISAPDVFTGSDSDAQATLDQFDKWCLPLQRVWSDVNEIDHQPIALVLQKGMEDLSIPWDEIDALFVGGTTDYKLSNAAADVVQEARIRGLWVHVGRVNSMKRVQHVIGIDADSFDGTGVVKYMDTVLPRLARAQLRSNSSFQPRLDELDRMEPSAKAPTARPLSPLPPKPTRRSDEGMTLF